MGDKKLSRTRTGRESETKFLAAGGGHFFFNTGAAKTLAFVTASFVPNKQEMIRGQNINYLALCTAVPSVQNSVHLKVFVTDWSTGFLQCF